MALILDVNEFSTKKSPGSPRITGRWWCSATSRVVRTNKRRNILGVESERSKAAWRGGGDDYVVVCCARGLAPAVGTSLGLQLSSEAASTSLASMLREPTVRAMLRVVAGSTSEADRLPARVVALTREVLKAMMMTKLRTTAVVALTASIVTVGVMVLVRQTQAERASLQEASQPEGKADRVGVIPFQRVGLNADDLAECTSLDIYKFRVDLAKGRRFRVVLRWRQDAKSTPRESSGVPFEATRDEPTTIRVSFLRSDRKLQGFLLSNEPEAEYRVTCSGGATGGFVTMIENPLGDIAPRLRGLVVHKSEESNAQEGHKQTRLLTVAAHQESGGRGVDISGYPRAEVFVTEDQ